MVNEYQLWVIVLSGALFLAWGVLSTMLFRTRRNWRAYGSALASAGFGVIFYRNLTGFSYMLTYIGNLLQLAAVVIFIKVTVILGENKIK